MCPTVLSAISARRGASVLVICTFFLSGSVPAIAGHALASDREVRELIDSISGSDMIATVRDLEDFGSRAFHLEQADMAAEYIHSRFSDLGMQVSYQEFSFGQHTSSNVVAVMPGRGADAGILLFGAHYDSENRLATNLSLSEALPAPGADDDASGVAAVIGLAGALREVETKHTIKFVAFGAEEMGFDDSGGLKGSSHFVALEKESGAKYECAVILDMIGYRSGRDNLAIMVTNSENISFADAASGTVSEWGLDLGLHILNSPNIRYSDHAPFWHAGYPAVLVAEELSYSGYPVNPHYHSSLDTSEHVSESQMENVTRCLMAATLTVLGVSEEGWGRTELAAVTLVSATALSVGIMFVWHHTRRRKRENS